MKVHFFSRIDSPNRSHFYNYSTYQNLRVVKVLSLIFIIVSVAIRFLVVLADLQIDSIQNIDEYNQGNWISISVTPFFYLCAVYLIKNYKENRRTRKIARFLSLVFAVYIMLTFMRTTFFNMHNPRNTMVMYLIGITAVSVLFTFEYFETIIITVITGICFALLLPFYQTGVAEIIMNNFASAILLTVFFCISRYSFSYRADNYLKIKAIEQKNREIELAIRAKNEILGIVAHDLRNPLAAIKTVAAIMKMEDKMDSEDHENLHMIETSCDKAAGIINDLLEMAHDEQQQDFDTEKIELNQFLLKIVDDWVKSRHGQSNILYYGTNKPVFVYLNSEKMERVMDNLISNAIKFSGSNNHIDIILRTEGDEVFIDVKDSGLGIPEDMLPFIFDRFSRASRRGVRGEESVGLGLSIVRQIITKHGGDIKVKSIEQQGTTFTITLLQVSY